MRSKLIIDKRNSVLSFVLHSVKQELKKYMYTEIAENKTMK